MRRILAFTTILCGLAALTPQSAAAHTGEPIAPHDIPYAWTFDPLTILGITTASVLYVVGLRKIWSRAGRGRAVSRWQAAAYAGGILALIIAVVSPLDALAGSLLSAHMVQHVILIALAAPLLVLGIPLVPMLAAVPPGWRREIGSRYRRWPGVRTAWGQITQPLVVVAVHILVLWLWHVPALYEAAVNYEAIHTLEHVMFLVTAMLFWWTVFQPLGRRRLSLGAGVLYVTITGMSKALLGTLLTFSTTIWYPIYIPTTPDFGLTPLEDQQLAGLIMWVPTAPLYVVVALALLATLIRDSERANPALPLNAPNIYQHTGQLGGAGLEPEREP